VPYTYENYPPSYQSLPDQARRKAVDIVKVFIRQGMDEKQAIRTAREHAVAWASTQSEAIFRHSESQHSQA
jgi:uncharacterized protein YdaT